jgi:hypothetical protein
MRRTYLKSSSSSGRLGKPAAAASKPPDQVENDSLRWREESGAEPELRDPVSFNNWEFALSVRFKL